MVLSGCGLFRRNLKGLVCIVADFGSIRRVISL